MPLVVNPPDRRQVNSQILAGAMGSILFDAGALINYFRNSRLPTGIQRVELNVIASLLRRGRDGVDMAVVCYAADLGCWVLLQKHLFLTVAELAVIDGDTSDPDWRDALRALELSIPAGNTFDFPTGAALLNLGASWWQPDFFMALRLAKESNRISYIPLIYDCIPILRPEFCDTNLHQVFLNWVLGVLDHADYYLAISQSSAREIAEVATQIRRGCVEPAVIRLDARFSSPGSEAAAPVWRNDEEHATLAALGSEPFVLFVSTIEPRKNHLLAFRAWVAMIRKRGLAHTPTLVCVGKLGWMHQRVMTFLQANELLQRKVVILSAMSDTGLAELYRRCLFTLFPSSHEGWGLPVTESLSYGRVPLITASSSLPEAGGEFAEYFDEFCERDLRAKLERLIDDTAYRTLREAKIAQWFHPRNWDDIADEIADCVLSFTATSLADPSPGSTSRAHLVEPRRYYPMALVDSVELSADLGNAERYLVGDGWWGLESWGTWMKGELAEIGFSLPWGENGAYLLYLRLVGLPCGDADYRVRVLEGDASERGALAEGEPRWVVLRIDSVPSDDRIIRVQVSSTGRYKIGEGNGKARIVTLGVIGFFVVREDDVSARQRFIEALSLNRLGQLDHGAVRH